MGNFRFSSSEMGQDLSSSLVPLQGPAVESSLMRCEKGRSGRIGGGGQANRTIRTGNMQQLLDFSQQNFVKRQASRLLGQRIALKERLGGKAGESVGGSRSVS